MRTTSQYERSWARCALERRRSRRRCSFKFTACSTVFVYLLWGQSPQVYLTGVQWSRHKATRPAYDSSPWDDTAQSHILKERKNRIQAGVTFVTCPKGPGFMETYENEVHALRSWILLLEPQASNVVLIGGPGDDALRLITFDLAAEARVKKRTTNVIFQQLTYRDIVHGKDGDSGPSVRAIFTAGESAVSSGHEIFIYVNTDIIFQSNVINIFGQVIQSFAPWKQTDIVISGSRTDCSGRKADVEASLKSDAQSVVNITQSFKSCVSHRPTGKDYFVYHRGFWQKHGGIPDFMIGRTSWDDYLTAIANFGGLFVDASAVVVALHLEHSYHHSAYHSKDVLWKSPSAKMNRKLLKVACKKNTGAECVSRHLNESRFRACPSFMDSIIVMKATSWVDNDDWLELAKKHSTWPRNCEFARDVANCPRACRLRPEQ